MDRQNRFGFGVLVGWPIVLAPVAVGYLIAQELGFAIGLCVSFLIFYRIRLFKETSDAEKTRDPV